MAEIPFCTFKHLGLDCKTCRLFSQFLSPPVMNMFCLEDPQGHLKQWCGTLDDAPQLEWHNSVPGKIVGVNKMVNWIFAHPE